MKMKNIKKWIKRLLPRLRWKKKAIEITNIKYHKGHFPVEIGGSNS